MPIPNTGTIASVQLEIIVDIASPLGVSVHGHVIVGFDGHVSLRGLKRI